MLPPRRNIKIWVEFLSDDQNKIGRFSKKREKRRRTLTLLMAQFTLREGEAPSSKVNQTWLYV